VTKTLREASTKPPEDTTGTAPRENEQASIADFRRALENLTSSLRGTVAVAESIDSEIEQEQALEQIVTGVRELLEPVDQQLAQVRASLLAEAEEREGYRVVPLVTLRQGRRLIDQMTLDKVERLVIRVRKSKPAEVVCAWLWDGNAKPDVTRSITQLNRQRGEILDLALAGKIVGITNGSQPVLCVSKVDERASVFLKVNAQRITSLKHGFTAR